MPDGSGAKRVRIERAHLEEDAGAAPGSSAAWAGGLEEGRSRGLHRGQLGRPGAAAATVARREKLELLAALPFWLSTASPLNKAPCPALPPGKLVYSGAAGLSGSDYSLVDYNRAGVPLLEIVSGPDLRSGQEAAAYGAEVRRVMRFLGVSDGNMAVRGRAGGAGIACLTWGPLGAGAGRRGVGGLGAAKDFD